MAAYFKNGDSSTEGRWYQWHVGEPLPRVVNEARVLTVQADGHELDALLEALERP